jgi:hypothetical protein
MDMTPRQTTNEEEKKKKIQLGTAQPLPEFRPHVDVDGAEGNHKSSPRAQHRNQKREV